MYSLTIETIDPKSDAIGEVEKFLDNFNLSLDKDIEEVLVARLDGEVVGTCSYGGKVIKCFAVKEEYQGEGLASKLLSRINNIMFDKGIEHTFVFTKLLNRYIFEQFGYREVYSTKDVALLEAGSHNIEKYIKSVYQNTLMGNEEKAAIVMNCNPFTLGHRYLIEKASRENNTVIVFIVEEDRSSFPFDVRYDLVRKGVSHLKNVYVVPGGDYIISSSTFPSYFIKEEEAKDRAYKELDAGIFGKYIAPAFNITKRYVGSEPFCHVTRGYNETLSRILPKYGIEVKIIDRLSIDGVIVSASLVRKLIREDDWEKIKMLVPETTYSFLISPEAKKISDSIKGSEGRH